MVVIRLVKVTSPSAKWCIFCRGPVSGWYEWRWETSDYHGAVCQQCWDERVAAPGHSKVDGGLEYSEEAQPGFQIMRPRMIQDWRK